MKALVLLLLLTGCASAPSKPLLDDVGDLRRHPQYRAALQAAPDFTREALTRLAERDHTLNSAP